MAVHIYTQTIHRTTQITPNVERVRAVPRLCEFYPGICLTTEEKARKNLSRGKKNLSQFKNNLSQSTVYILPKHPHKHAYYKTHTHTHTHITKQYKTTTAQIKTNTVQDIPIWNSHNIIKCQQYKDTLMWLVESNKGDHQSLNTVCLCLFIATWKTIYWFPRNFVLTLHHQRLIQFNATSNNNILKTIY